MNDNADINGSAVDIVEAGRLMIASGLVAGAWGNISCRCQNGCCLITPSGIPYTALQPGDLMAVDLQSWACSGSLRPSTETPLHAAIYRARPDVGALDKRAAVLLANHGLVGVGRTVQEALTVCQVAERSAQVWLWAKLTGTPHLLEEQEVRELRQGYLTHYGQGK